MNERNDVPGAIYLARDEEADALMALIGEWQPPAVASESGGAVDPALLAAQEQFYDWLARDLRLRQRPADRLLAARRARVFADRMLAKAMAVKLGVRCPANAATMRRAAVMGSMQQAVIAAHERAQAPVAEFAVAAGAGRELWEQECESWVDLPADVPSGRYVALRVAGDSMTPLLHSGDTVLVKLGAELARDTVVVARCDDGYVVKRVGRITRQELELISLNPAFPLIRVRRTEGAVLGTVMLRWCAHEGRG